MSLAEGPRDKSIARPAASISVLSQSAHPFTALGRAVHKRAHISVFEMEREARAVRVPTVHTRDWRCSSREMKLR